MILGLRVISCVHAMVGVGGSCVIGVYWGGQSATFHCGLGEDIVGVYAIVCDCVVCNKNRQPCIFEISS